MVLTAVFVVHLAISGVAQAQTLATMTNPANGATNVNPNAPFTWTSVASAQGYYLYIGSGVGLKDVYGSGALSPSVTSITVSNLQASTTYYIRLWTELNNCWCKYVDSIFTTGATGSLPSQASMISPANGATNVDPTAPFTWTTAANAQGYYLYIGSAVGLKDIYGSGGLSPSVTSITVSGLQGATTYYIRLWTEVNSCWCKYVDSTFTTGASGSPPTYATMISPANGATNVNPTSPFTWTAASSAQGYYLYIGSAVGLKDIYGSGGLGPSITSITVSNLQATTTYYIRLWTEVNNCWCRYVDSTFTTGASASPRAYATMITPANGATNVDPATSFTWTSVPNAQGYYVYVGSAVGLKDVYGSGALSPSVTSISVPGLQSSTTYYVRLWTESSNCWCKNVDSTFTTANVAPSRGQWTAPVSWSFYMTHAMLLPTGKVLWWPSWAAGDTPTVWDPVANTNTPTTLAGYNIFCAGHAQLGNGQVLVTGGDSSDSVGPPTAMIYDPNSAAWTQLPDMNAGRWYPTNTALPSGDMLVTGGEISPTLGVDTLPQVWQVASSSWRNLTTAQLALPLYPEMFVAPDGSVFYAGPTQPSRYLNTAGTGSWTSGPANNFGTRDYGPPVVYDSGKILVVGGGDPPTATAEVINLNDPTPTWHYTSTMANARRQANATLLPDGTVLVTGGSSGSGFDNTSSPVFASELWNPATGNWATLASLPSVYRGYHSIALLLPDGRVLSGGGNSTSAEIFSPPYLFNGPRPTITSVPATASAGQSFLVASPDAANITKVSLIRLGAVTHTVNMNQVANFPSFTQVAGGLNVSLSPNQNALPPGDYMLFLVNTNGVPSVASFIRIVLLTSTTTVVASNNNPSVNGQTVTFTASVSPSTATGVVQFLDGSNVLGSASLVSGAATFSTSSLTAGAHTITAVYSGDANDAGSTSSAISQTVNLSSTSVSLSSDNNPSIFGQVVDFTAIVSPGTATGNVQFSDGGSALGTVTITGGKAVYSTSSVAMRSHNVAAAYSGDANDAASSSVVLSQTVKPRTQFDKMICSC